MHRSAKEEALLQPEHRLLHSDRAEATQMEAMRSDIAAESVISGWPHARKIRLGKPVR